MSVRGLDIRARAVRALVRIVPAAILAYGLAAVLRYGLVERDDLGDVCAVAHGWWCGVRQLVIQGFLHDVYGRASVVLALLAAWRRSGPMATAALVIGVVGTVLYRFPASGVGVLLGALVIARLQGQWQQDPEPERQR